MKRLAFRIVALMLCMCAALASYASGALASSAPGAGAMHQIWQEKDGSLLTFSLESGNKATLVSVVTDQETLNIDIWFEYNREKYIVTKIAQNAFEGCENLKYVLMSADSWKQVGGREYDFRSAENLETVFVNDDVNYIVTNQRVSFLFAHSSVELLQYRNMADKPIRNVRVEYQNGSVTLSFNDVFGNLSGCEYRIEREEQGSGKPPVEFRSNDDVARFAIANGIVWFTDNTVEPGKTYKYTITAWEPMGSSSQPGYAEITIPMPPVSEPPAFEPGIPMPETGDGADFALWMGMLAVSAIGILTLGRKARKEY